jgi:hypothetical protein
MQFACKQVKSKKGKGKNAFLDRIYKIYTEKEI